MVNQHAIKIGLHTTESHVYDDGLLLQFYYFENVLIRPYVNEHINRLHFKSFHLL